MEDIIMREYKLSLLLCTPALFAASIYNEPTDEADVVAEVESSHEYAIETQDWAQITDKTTNQTGWVKLSEMKKDLSNNSQWSYQWHSTSEGTHQTMYYKPFTASDISKHIRKVHQQHKKIMSAFDSFWDDLEDDADQDQA